MQRFALNFRNLHSRPFITGATLALALTIFASGLIYQGVKSSLKASTAPVTVTCFLSVYINEKTPNTPPDQPFDTNTHRMYGCTDVSDWGPLQGEPHCDSTKNNGYCSPSGYSVSGKDYISCVEGVGGGPTSELPVDGAIYYCDRTGPTTPVNTWCAPALGARCSLPNFSGGNASCLGRMLGVDTDNFKTKLTVCLFSKVKGGGTGNPSPTPPKPTASVVPTPSGSFLPTIYLNLHERDNAQVKVPFTSAADATCPGAVEKKDAVKDTKGQVMLVTCSFNRTDAGKKITVTAKAKTGGKVQERPVTIPATTLTSPLSVEPAFCRVAKRLDTVTRLLSRAMAQENCGVIEGTVTDKETKQPIKGVTLNLFAFIKREGGASGRIVKTTISGDDGRYTFGELSLNTYYYVVETESDDYIKERGLDILGSSLKVPAKQNFELIPDNIYFLYGRITDIEERPLAGIKILIKSSLQPPKFKEEIVTDKDGMYKSSTLKKDHYIIDVTNPSSLYGGGYKSGVEPEKAPGARYDFKLNRRGAFIEGTVKDEKTDQPLSHVEIKTTQNKGQDSQTTETDNKGYYKIDHLESVETVIDVTLKDYQDEKAIMIPREGGSEVNFTLRYNKPGTITQKFIWKKSQTIPNPPWSCLYKLCTGTVKQATDIANQSLKVIGRGLPITTQVKAVLKVPNTQDGFTTTIYNKSTGEAVSTIIQEFKRPTAPDPFTSEGESEEIPPDDYTLETKMSGWICLSVKRTLSAPIELIPVATDVVFTNNITLEPGEKKELPTQNFSAYKLQPHAGLTSEHKCR